MLPTVRDGGGLRHLEGKRRRGRAPGAPSKDEGMFIGGASVTRGFVTEPQSGKGRDIPLSDEAIAALKAERHLRGPLVFCDAAGRMWKKNEVKHPLWRACRKAGLRQIGWHVLRDTFASHLVMRGDGDEAGAGTARARHHRDDAVRASQPDVSRQAVKLLDGLGGGTGIARRQLGDSDRLAT